MRKKITILILILVLSMFAYLSVFLVSTWESLMYNLSRPDRQHLVWSGILNILGNRSVQLVALIMVSMLTASTTLTFQTLTKSRILTPAVIGFDSIFIMIQTTLVFFFSSVPNLYLDPILNFIISFLIMTSLSIFIYLSVLRKHRNNIVFLLLLGLIISTLASNYVNLLQVLMEPETFQTVQALTTVSVVNIEVSLVWLSIPLAILIMFFLFKKNHVYDVMLLGDEVSKNLGIDYNKESIKNLVLISLAVSLTTALVGPLSFLGLIAVNISIELFKDYKHKNLYIFGSLLAAIVLIFGQSIIELTGFHSTVTTLISFGGGVYMMILILKENRA